MNDNLESRYKILKPLGRGGFGKVYKAKDQRLDNFVAIKKIVPALDDDPEILAMVREEAILTRKLEDHPNIVKIYDLVEGADQLAIIMEYINGVDLGKFIKTYKVENRYMPPRIALHIIGEVCKALNHAHTTKDKITGQPLKIVHRDVSPSNIMITFSGDIKVIDFGIAKAEFDARSTRTTTGRLKGKYHYLSPEHGRKIRMDGRSDIYPLGAVLYETLTGAKLFDHQNTLELMDAARNAIIPSQKFESDLIPQEVKRIIKKAVAKDLDKRYQSAWAMYEDIDAILQKLGAKPADLKRELSEIMSKIPASDDDEVDPEGLTPLPPKPELLQETIPLKSPIVSPPAITAPEIAGESTKTISVSIPDPPRQPVTPATKPGNYKKAAIILAAVLALAMIAFSLIFFKPSTPQLKLQIAANLDSALVVIDGQSIGTTPREFFQPLARPFALALYRAGYDTVAGFYYRGNNEFQVTDNALWQYEPLQDSSMSWRVQGSFYKNVYFKTSPVSATVNVDNDTTPAGVTNRDSIRLFVGMHQITLRPNTKGYQEDRFDLFVDARLDNLVNRTLQPPARKPVELRRITILAKDAENNKVITSARVVNVSDNTNATIAVAVVGSAGTRRNVTMGVQNKVREFLATPVEIELPRRAFKIKVAAPGGYLDKTQDISLEQTGEVLFVLERGPTNGVTIEVKDATTKMPILQGKVWICKGKKLSDCQKENIGFDGELFGELNAYGSYTRQFRPGKYLCKIECPNYELYITTTPFEVISGANLLSFELTRKQ